MEPNCFPGVEPGMWLLVAAAIAVGTPDHGKVDRTDITYDVRGTATLTISLSTHELVRQTATLTIDVPHGARVTAMAVTIGGARTDATAMAAGAAERRFAEIVDSARDPALLEQTESTRDYDRLTLHVFPIAKTSPARVEIVIELPELASATPRRHVSPFTSLLAAEPPPAPPVLRRPRDVWFCDGRI